ncbi:putative membrane protein [Saccharothrix tamanrassetensis]|uniref:Putative membrane protein n=1 Tax=Saccharothrix tamanrassetensis TaxID=1051531 RepID=A0A841CA95_9PSEU|nr:papain-like cysteine protease family protein [Saccharothrix tamanrassetensis]MBB5953863.1 putative membrane protein [Saccharothrix tamanrassetensis]
MDRKSTRRRLPCLVAIAAAFATAVALPAPAMATGDQSTPHGLIKTEEHTQVKEVAPARAPLSATPLATKKLNYTQQVQQQNQWCWAATGASIEQTLGVTVSQQAFCAAGKGSSAGYCPNQAAQIPEIVRGFRGTGFNAQDARGPIGFASITQQIDAGIPHLTGIYWTSGGGHAEVIYGYDSTNQSVFIGDPWPSYQRYQTWTYNQYRSNSRFRWNDTIVNITKA